MRHLHFLLRHMLGADVFFDSVDLRAPLELEPCSCNGTDKC